MSALWAIITLTASLEFLLYLTAKVWIPGASRGLRSELWWTTSFIAGPLHILSGLTHAIQDFDWYDPLLLVSNVALWWIFVVKDDDRDDRWKKRRKKATAKIKEVSGRLVVVPVPHPT